MDKIEAAKEKFGALIEEQLKRVEKIKFDKDFIDFQKLDLIKIGIVGGDGIGPAITKQAQRILEFLLADEVANGKVEFKVIDGLTIENRIKAGKAIPDDVLAEIKECPVILKGPTTTPRAGDKVNIESANVAMRKELDLFANVRPVKIPEEGIDWTFYRENTEGSYTLGSKGFNIDDDLAFDFTVATTDGTERLLITRRKTVKQGLPLLQRQILLKLQTVNSLIFLKKLLRNIQILKPMTGILIL